MSEYSPPRDILTAVASMDRPNLPDIRASVDEPPSRRVADEVQQLVQRGYLRMVDDDQSHEWGYRLTEAGRRELARPSLADLLDGGKEGE